MDKEGWTAEMRIPLSQIRFSPKDNQVWGLQVRRTLFRNNESSDWQMIPRNASGTVHMFGELRGLEGLAAPHQIEIMPCAVGSLQSYRPVPANPFASGGKQTIMGGDGDFSQDNLFYSRRIGRDPHYAPSIDGYIDRPSTTAILGAFKLSGKTKSGFSLGVLESVTAKESAATFSGYSMSIRRRWGPMPATSSGRSSRRPWV